MWKVTYAIDSLDPNPTVKTFDTEYEAQEWLHEEAYSRVDHMVQHSPYSVSVEEYEQWHEQELALARIDRVD
jgi:hypothetical protein